MSKKGVRPNRCPYCGRKCDGAACAQHRELAEAEQEGLRFPKRADFKSDFAYNVARGSWYWRRGPA